MSNEQSDWERDHIFECVDDILRIGKLYDLDKERIEKLIELLEKYRA